MNFPTQDWPPEGNHFHERVSKDSLSGKELTGLSYYTEESGKERTFYGKWKGFVKMRRTGALEWVSLLAFSGLCALGFANSMTGPHQSPVSPPNMSAEGVHYRLASVEDLKRSEKYLKKDLGLGESPENSGEPLWKVSMAEHPFLVALGALMFVGGSIALVLVLRRQNRLLKEGQSLARSNENRPGGGYGTALGLPVPIQEVIAKETQEIQSLPSVPIEKIPRKVDGVLDSLRLSVGIRAGKSRLSLFRFDEKANQFRICGFSKGEEFQTFNPLLAPPKEILSAPLRSMTHFSENGAIGKDPFAGWFYPFVIDSGELCVLILEMPEGNPPDNWVEYIQGSLQFLKALVARQESSREDVTLKTRDDSGSLDYRGTMNSLLEEWGRARILKIPFVVIAIRVDNMTELIKYFGIAPMNTAWNKFIARITSLLRPTDKVMRPERDLVLLHILEVGIAEGHSVQKRIVDALAKSAQLRTIDRSMHFRGVMMAYSVESSISPTTFFDQILHRFDERVDFDGEYFFK